MKYKKWRVRLLTFVFLSGLLFACNNSNPVKPEDIPVPPAARKAEIDGFEKEQFNNALTAAITVVKNRYKTVESETYRLENETTWRELAAFYDDKLREKEFVRNESEPFSSLDSQILFWERKGLLGKEFVSVVLITTNGASAGEKRYFLLLCAGG